MLNCKDVTYLASDYLDNNAHGLLPWQIRMHLLACSCCRRFIRHLKITTKVVPQFVYQQQAQELNTEDVLRRIKERRQRQEES